MKCLAFIPSVLNCWQIGRIRGVYSGKAGVFPIFLYYVQEIANPSLNSSIFFFIPSEENQIHCFPLTLKSRQGEGQKKSILPSSKRSTSVTILFKNFVKSLYSLREVPDRNNVTRGAKIEPAVV